MSTAPDAAVMNSAPSTPATVAPPMAESTPFQPEKSAPGAAPGSLFFGSGEKPGQKQENLVASTLQPTNEPTSDFSWSSYFQAIGVLFLMLALLWLGLHFFRRHGGGRFLPQSMSRNALRVEAQLALGQRKGIYVVRFLNKRLVLGVTDQNISLLTETEVRDEQATAESDSFGDSAPDRAAGPDFSRSGKSG